MEAYNREGTLFSIITITNDILTCNAEKLCIHLAISMYACFLPFSSYRLSHIYFAFKSIKITLSLFSIALCVRMS